MAAAGQEPDRLADYRRLLGPAEGNSKRTVKRVPAGPSVATVEKIGKAAGLIAAGQAVGQVAKVLGIRPDLDGGTADQVP